MGELFFIGVVLLLLVLDKLATTDVTGVLGGGVCLTVYYLILLKIKSKKANTDIDESGIIKFIAACKEFEKEHSRPICIAGARRESQNSVFVYMDVGEAVSGNIYLYKFFDNDEYDTFMQQPDKSVYDLIKLLDMSKLRNKFGENVRIKPSEIDDDGIELYVAHQLPKRVKMSFYISCLARKLRHITQVEKKGIRLRIKL